MSTVDLRFIFPNYDGVNVFMSTNKSAKGIQLKTHLMENWPAALEPCTDPDRIRLICMGMGIIKDSAVLGEWVHNHSRMHCFLLVDGFVMHDV
jgi:hypothetical protein